MYLIPQNFKDLGLTSLEEAAVISAMTYVSGKRFGNEPLKALIDAMLERVKSDNAYKAEFKLFLQEGCTLRLRELCSQVGFNFLNPHIELGFTALGVDNAINALDSGFGRSRQHYFHDQPRTVVKIHEAITNANSIIFNGQKMVVDGCSYVGDQQVTGFSYEVDQDNWKLFATNEDGEEVQLSFTEIESLYNENKIELYTEVQVVRL